MNSYQENNYTQASGTTLNEVPAPQYTQANNSTQNTLFGHPSGDNLYNKNSTGVASPLPATHQNSYHQDTNPTQPIYHDPFQSTQAQQQPPPAFHQPDHTQVQHGNYNQGPQFNNSGNYPTPLHSLQQYPDTVSCPICGVRERTRTEYSTGGTTHLAAFAACFIACLGCIPYLTSWFKDCEHYCGNCGAVLAVWHRSGHTEVMAGKGAVGVAVPVPVKGAKKGKN